MRNTYITAGIIGLVVVAWLLTGQLREPPEPIAKNISEQNRRVAAMGEERTLTRVRVTTLHASERTRLLKIRGRTQNKRSVNVQSQISGLVKDRFVERGDSVAAGDLLCEITLEDRAALLAEASAAAEQAKIEHEGSLKLSKEGLQSETVIAQTKARLASAVARQKRAQLDIQRLKITAPFAGVIEDIHMEAGQFVTPGSACATLVDLDPMLIMGQVAESELLYVRSGMAARAVLSSGAEVAGDVTFVASTAEPGTRTYQLEVKLDNRDRVVPSGITAQIILPVETVTAQKISPALLVLDDEGAMGVRTVNSEA
ncbi:MAG: efflux RND transporter periplasmic adaptor subunit, partial [Pseudomonadales bacterium]